MAIGKAVRRDAVRLILVAAVIGFAGPSFAQTAPDAGTILRGIQRSTPDLTKPAEPATPVVPQDSPPILKGGQTVRVLDFRIRCTLFPEATLKEVIKDYLGREDSLGDLEEAAAKLSSYYRDHGYLARAYLPRQTIRDGIVEIVVVEGRLGAVSTDPATVSRLSPDIAVGTVLAQQESGDFLRPAALGDAIAELNGLPGVSATATLVPGQTEGASDVIVSLKDTPLLTGGVSADNANPRAIGSWRSVGSAALNDAFGAGDQESITLLKSTGSQYGRVAAQLPVTYSGLTLGINASALQFATAKEINVSEPSGIATTQGVTASQTLLRSETAVFVGQASFDHKHLVNQAEFVITSDNRVNVGGLGVSGSMADDLLGEGGVTMIGLTGSLGSADLGADHDNLQSDQKSFRTQGTYGKLAGNLKRTQPLPGDCALGLALSGQWAAKNLDSSEKFSLGGPDGVRAYPVNEANGDKGWLASLEARHTPVETVQVALFYDVGGITLHADKNSGWQQVGPLPNSYVLQGTGLWASWAPVPWITLKGTLAQTLGTNPGATAGGYDNDGTRSHTRAWLQAMAVF